MRIRLHAALGAVATVLTLSAMPFRPSSAQEPRFTGRLPEPTRAQVDALLEAARTEGLPIEPLVDRALEGASKGAPGDRIVAAVRRLAEELRVARDGLGSGAMPEEIAAGAGALRAGVLPRELARLRSARGRQPLTVAVGVLADLVAVGVPADTAVRAVLALAESADDATYIAFRRNVERDVALGASPVAALGVRLGAFIPGETSDHGVPAATRKP